MNEVMELRIILDESYTVENETCSIQMVLFHGECSSTFFHGSILPGGVDTQKREAGKQAVLSARYIIKGVDSRGSATRIFIENNGTADENGQVVTHPVIYTDNRELEWLEKTKMIGRIENRNEELWIRFYKE